ncbi:MAG TPA: gfo/Idh/MocA family oxidoreductase, partial [Chloroflexi bacterium]|nr:gfo/Idh/MocA family oxidoreductase [Chloroflexota bacterium]
MRIGIVGTGFMGSAHAAAWAATDAEIVGFVTKDAATGSRLAAQYQAKIYPDLPAMLADVDVVDICTPTHLHEEMVLTAAAARKHI